jgi:hypothetical protein
VQSVSLRPRLQVNVGTSGAEIGAAFGGNKVRPPFCDLSVRSPHTALRAQAGDERLAETPGSNTSAGVHALSISLIRPPWPKVSILHRPREPDCLNERSYHQLLPPEVTRTTSSILDNEYNSC